MKNIFRNCAVLVKKELQTGGSENFVEFRQVSGTPSVLNTVAPVAPLRASASRGGSECGTQSAHMRLTPSASPRGTHSRHAALRAAALGGSSPALLAGVVRCVCVLPHALTDFRGPIGKSWDPLPGGPVMTRRHPNGEWAEAFP
jgi:hypothetical protein